MFLLFWLDFSYVPIKNTSKQHIYKKKVNMKIYFSSKNNLDLQTVIHLVFSICFQTSKSNSKDAATLIFFLSMGKSLRYRTKVSQFQILWIWMTN